MTRLSCHRFRSNEVRLWLSVIAYNLGNLWRRLVLPKRIDKWSLTSLQQRLVKTGGRLVKHARYHWLLLADSHLTRWLFGAVLRRIELWPDQRDRPARRLGGLQYEKATDEKVSETSVKGGIVPSLRSLREPKLPPSAVRGDKLRR